MKKLSPFWYWRDPRWSSSCDTPGSFSTPRKSDGTHVMLLAGANFAITTASQPFSGLYTRCVPPRLHRPDCFHAHRKSRTSGDTNHPHLIMRHSRMSSVSRQPLSYHLIGRGTVRSTCCLELNLVRVEFILCPSRSARLWRNTSRRL